MSRKKEKNWILEGIKSRNNNFFFILFVRDNMISNLFSCGEILKNLLVLKYENDEFEWREDQHRLILSLIF